MGIFSSSAVNSATSILGICPRYHSVWDPPKSIVFFSMNRGLLGNRYLSLVKATGSEWVLVASLDDSCVSETAVGTITDITTFCLSPFVKPLPLLAFVLAVPLIFSYRFKQIDRFDEMPKSTTPQDDLIQICLLKRLEEWVKANEESATAAAACPMSDRVVNPMAPRPAILEEQDQIATSSWKNLQPNLP